MNYSDLLKKYIKDSRLTLDEISEKLNSYNLSASKQYLSKLQNDKLPPASESLNRAIAEITGGDPEELIVAAYLEKAPEEVKKRINVEEQPKESNHTETTDEELEKLLDHPDMGMWYKELKGSPEENRQKALDFLRWLNEQEKKDNQK